ncbi:MAG: TetR/AcrR family transcriptional regulator C-terminal domain-containing protein [Lachnospiraceae bacterium]|nr:TetR/AcrR family transcriptional regulator C-terminal domain-containing protein [Lachnospiraceae bacterium]
MKQSVTSLNTKKMMVESLKKIMCQKPLSKITVTEIIRDCDINRKTFYYHFDDIYALVKWMFEEEAIDVVKKFNLLDDYEDALLFIMDYIEQNQHIIHCACDSISRAEMKRFFYSDFFEIVTSIIVDTEQMHQKTLKPDFKQFLCEFYTNALAGILMDWIQNRENRSREHIIQYVSSILKSSIFAALENPENLQ